jgi:hypothetical protein
MRPTPTVLTLAVLLAMSANAEMILTVRVYDYTGLSDNTVLKAEALARQIFHKAGVETDWVHCPTERGEEDRFPGCRKPRSESDIILHILPQSMENRRLSGDAYGFALHASGGLPAQHAYVFFHRVEQAARKSERTARAISQPALLAHVVAHEIGHLLLGPNSHSGRGVMRARWRPEDLQEMEIGQLVFAAEQAKLIRGRMDGRANGRGK